MRVRRVLTAAGGFVLVGATVWLAVTTLWIWRNQERVVFQPPDVVPPDPTGARRVEYLAPDGTRLYGYLVAPAAATESTIVVVAFHGNADQAAWLVPWAQELSRRTVATVVIPEYRGYGGIPGPPTYASASSDASGAIKFARTFRPRRIVLYGHSLGSAIAAEQAAAMRDQPPAALALQSPFTSAREMALRMLVPVIPWLWERISRVHYDTRALVQTLSVDVWVAHGTADLTIPVRMGRAVFAAARQRGRLLVVAGAGHNDVPELGGEAYWKWLTDAVTGPPSAPIGELEQQGRGRFP